MEAYYLPWSQPILHLTRRSVSYDDYRRFPVFIATSNVSRATLLALEEFYAALAETFQLFVLGMVFLAASTVSWFNTFVDLEPGSDIPHRNQKRGNKLSCTAIIYQ